MRVNQLLVVVLGQLRGRNDGVPTQKIGEPLAKTPPIAVPSDLNECDEIGRRLGHGDGVGGERRL